jgi:hypothetical protein
MEDGAHLSTQVHKITIPGSVGLCSAGDQAPLGQNPFPASPDRFQKPLPRGLQTFNLTGALSLIMQT